MGTVIPFPCRPDAPLAAFPRAQFPDITPAPAPWHGAAVLILTKGCQPARCIGFEAGKLVCRWTSMSQGAALTHLEGFLAVELVLAERRGPQGGA